MHNISLGPHPMELCRQLTPIPESPESPHPSESNQPSTSKTYHLCEISTIAQNLQFSHYVHICKTTIIGCLVCGKPYEQVIDETAADCLCQTAQPHETIRERFLKRRAFIEGFQHGVFTFVPKRVSQAASSDR